MFEKLFSSIRSVLLLSLGMVASAAVFAQPAPGQIELTDSPRKGDVTLVATDAVADVWVDEGDFAVVRIAADCFASDVERVTGKRPRF